MSRVRYENRISRRSFTREVQRDLIVHTKPLFNHHGTEFKFIMTVCFKSVIVIIPTVFEPPVLQKNYENSNIHSFYCTEALYKLRIEVSLQENFNR